MAKKKINRKVDSEIKKQLRNFAKKEYNEKKPLEIRVLMLKPGVVFKKGSMLPNLMIKNLTGAAYVIYLDYGDQLKFYYFSKEGRSMGGANFDKSEKLLKEMHGKAKILLKLPKTVKVIGLEDENKNLLKHWKKLHKRYSRKYQAIRKPYLTISIKKNIPKNNIRIGIEQSKENYHFDYEYCNTDIQDTILLRELYPQYTRKPAINETLQMIATIWALSVTDSKEYIQILKNIPLNKKINTEAIHWIEDVLVPFSQSKSKERIGFGRFLINSCFIVNERNLSVFHDFFDLYLLWLMVNGCKIFPQFFIFDPKHWLFFEMLEFFYTEIDLCQKYGINKHNDKNLVLIHLCTRFILGRESKVDRKFLSTIYPNYSQMEQALEYCQFFEFYRLIPEPVYIKDRRFLDYMLDFFLTQRGIFIEGVNSISMPRNTERKIEIFIKNITDWPLNDLKFEVNFHPIDSLSRINTDYEKTCDHKINLDLFIKSADKKGKCNLYILMFFKNPLYPDVKQSIAIRSIDVDIQ